MTQRVDQTDQLGNSWPTLLPSNVTSPAPGFLLVSLGTSFTLDAMRVADGGDVLHHAEFEVRTAPGGEGTLVQSLSTTAGQLSVILPALTLLTGKTLYVRGRAVGTNLGPAPWSADVQITT